jgi:hypothetical protein
MLEMKTPDPPAAITSSKASSTLAAPSRSTARMASGAAWTGQAGSMDHRGHGPDLRRQASQRCDGRGVGDVDLLSDDPMALVAQPLRRRSQGIGVVVGEHQGRARAQASGNSASHAADAGNDFYCGAQRFSSITGTARPPSGGQVASRESQAAQGADAVGPGPPHDVDLAADAVEAED